MLISKNKTKQSSAALCLGWMFHYQNIECPPRQNLFREFGRLRGRPKLHNQYACKILLCFSFFFFFSWTNAWATTGWDDYAFGTFEPVCILKSMAGLVKRNTKRQKRQTQTSISIITWTNHSHYSRFISNLDENFYQIPSRNSLPQVGGNNFLVGLLIDSKCTRLFSSRVPSSYSMKVSVRILNQVLQNRDQVYFCSINSESQTSPTLHPATPITFQPALNSIQNIPTANQVTIYSY